MEDFLPAFTSVISRAARAFMSGPAAKLTCAFSPYFLLKPVSSSARPFRPPKVCAPATKTISSPSFFAPAMSCSAVSAACNGQSSISARKIKSARAIGLRFISPHPFTSF